MRFKVFLVVGARPNFMKIAPIWQEMKKYPERFEPMILHTGQHYDKNMSRIFFEDLELPEPDIYLGVGSESHAKQTATIMAKFEDAMIAHKPHMVMVVGDVNSTIACTLAAIKTRIQSDELRIFRRKLDQYLSSKRSNDTKRNRLTAADVPITAHIEAGERSFDYSMPEEINRVTTDVLSDFLFATTEQSCANLMSEGIEETRIFHVGNIMIDSMLRLLPKASQSTIRTRLSCDDEYALVTLHRAGNVDHIQTLQMLLSTLVRVSKHVQVIFPMHPRTQERLSKLDNDIQERLEQSNVLIIEPVGYLDFLNLQQNARLVMTDSGGVQVETSYLGVPCLTLRPNTEWQITLTDGTNRLVALSEDTIYQSVLQVHKLSKPKSASIKYWDGHTAIRIVTLFQDIFF